MKYLLATTATPPQYLRGPSPPEQVKRDGYSFTTDRSQAWPFATEALALAKLRIVQNHMGDPFPLVMTPEIELIPDCHYWVESESQPLDIWLYRGNNIWNTWNGLHVGSPWQIISQVTPPDLTKFTPSSPWAEQLAPPTP